MENRVHDLVFKELIKKGYSKEGDSKLWDLSDSKLSYVTPEQAQAYLDFQAVTQYKTALSSKEVNLIRGHINMLIETFKGECINIIDLGCGDGKKVVSFIEDLSKVAKIRYCPIDISGYMVEKAIERVKNIGVSEVIEFQWNISDFDNLENIVALLNSGVYKKNLFLLLGNTLGNFEMHELLHQIRNSMGVNDYLLIGNGINNNKVDESVVDFLKKSKEHALFEKLLPMQLGFKEDDLKYVPRFMHSRLEMVTEVLKGRDIKLYDKTISIKKKDKFLCAFCYYLKDDEFKSMMNLYFSEANVFIYEDGSYTIALCKK